MKAIPLTQGYTALVDDEDFDWLSKHKWCAGSTGGGYCAMTNIRDAKGKLRSARMHTMLMKPPKGMVVDHINHNQCDNRKENLRVCTPQQNRFNSKSPVGSISLFKGVTWEKGARKWRVRFALNGKKINIGMFTDEREAALAYNVKAKELLGEFAYLNKIS